MGCFSSSSSPAATTAGELGAGVAVSCLEPFPEEGAEAGEGLLSLLEDDAFLELRRLFSGSFNDPPVEPLLPLL